MFATLAVVTASLILSQTLQFEVATIKPNSTVSNNAGTGSLPGGGLSAENVTLKSLIRFAWKVRDPQVTGGPGWIGSERYDIAAKAPEGARQDQAPLMLQALLADRFKLRLHRESREVAVYFLVPAKGGMKLQKATEGSCAAVSAARCGNMMIGMNGLTGSQVGMDQLTDALSGIAGRAVIDRTGLKGEFDVHLEFARDGGANDAALPSVFTAVQEQLGLRLESGKGAIEILVIDRAEKPSEN